MTTSPCTDDPADFDCMAQALAAIHWLVRPLKQLVDRGRVVQRVDRPAARVEQLQPRVDPQHSVDGGVDVRRRDWAGPRAGAQPIRRPDHPAALHPQGQRPLWCNPSKDLQQEVVAPAAATSLHGDAILAWMLLEQREREPIQPGKVLADLGRADA